MIPSRKEMTAYWFAHPIAGTVIAFAMLEAGKTLWESAVNPKGKSPFSTYFGGSYDPTVSYDATDPNDAAEPHTHRISDLEAIADLKSHHDDTHYNNHKKLLMPEAPLGTFGSSSTTTSTSSAHGGTIRNPTGSTWDKHKAPGENADMFGMPQKKGTILMGPPSARRRISLNAFTLGGLSQAPQKIGTPEEDGLPKTSHFDILGMMPEQSDDATDNPWV